MNYFCNQLKHICSTAIENCQWGVVAVLSAALQDGYHESVDTVHSAATSVCGTVPEMQWLRLCADGMPSYTHSLQQYLPSLSLLFSLICWSSGTTDPNTWALSCHPDLLYVWKVQRRSRGSSIRYIPDMTLGPTPPRSMWIGRCLCWLDAAKHVCMQAPTFLTAESVQAYSYVKLHGSMHLTSQYISYFKTQKIL